MAMKDAFYAEEQYITSRAADEESRPLADILREHGFDSLEAYHTAKQEWLFSQCDFTEMNTVSDVAFQVIGQILQNEKPVLLFENHATPFIYRGDKELDVEKAKAAGITVYDGGYAGGTIVGGVGDLSIGIFFPLSIELRADYFLRKLADIFQAHGVPAVVDHNDILVDGAKVIGSAHLVTENYYGFVAYVSFSDKAELVRTICGDAVKKPGYLTGITLPELEEALRAWLL